MGARCMLDAGVVPDHVEKGSTISTDELIGYNLVTGDGYVDRAVDHSRREYAWTDHQSGETFSTNAAGSFWRLFKNSVRSTHIHVSQKHLGRYLGEFSFRSKYRHTPNAMFDLLIGRFDCLGDRTVKLSAVDRANSARLSCVTNTAKRLDSNASRNVI